MSTTLLPLPRSVFYDANGNPLSGGLVNTYVPNTVTPKTTWEDSGQATPNANPIVLDAAGSALIYGSGGYTLAVTDSLGNAIPAYSGLTTDFATASGISAAMAPVVAADTIEDGFNLLAVDGGAIGPVTATSAGVWTNTQMNFNAQFLMGGIDPTQAFQSEQQGNNSTVPLTAGILIPGTSTVHEGTSLFATVQNYSTVTEGVAGTFFSVASGANTAGSFGINVLVSDGGFSGTSAIVGCEWDMGASNVDTWTVGNNMIAVFPNGTPTRSTGYQVSANSVEDSVANPWELGFGTAEGAAITAFAAGPLLNGTVSASQPMTFYSIGTDGTLYGANIQSQAYADGEINIIAQTESGSFINSGGLIQEGGAILLDGMTVFSASDTLLAGFYAYTSQVNTTTSGDTPLGSTSFIVADASGISMGQDVGAANAGIQNNTTVSSVAGTTVNISMATLADLPSGTAVEFSAASSVGSITTNGSSVTYNTTSDRSLKTIKGAADGSIISKIKVYTGSFKRQPAVERSMIIADELQQVAPFAVAGEPGATYQADVVKRGGIRVHKGKSVTMPDMVIHKKGDPILQMVDHSALVPDIIAHAQSLEAEIVALKAELAKLKPA